jgi:hypothetical protein
MRGHWFSSFAGPSEQGENDEGSVPASFVAQEATFITFDPPGSTGTQVNSSTDVVRASKHGRSGSVFGSYTCLGNLA